MCEEFVLSGKTDWMRAVTHMGHKLLSGASGNMLKKYWLFKLLRHIYDALSFFYRFNGNRIRVFVFFLQLGKLAFFVHSLIFLIVMFAFLD